MYEFTYILYTFSPVILCFITLHSIDKPFWSCLLHFKLGASLILVLRINNSTSKSSWVRNFGGPRSPVRRCFKYYFMQNREQIPAFVIQNKGRECFHLRQKSQNKYRQTNNDGIIPLLGIQGPSASRDEAEQRRSVPVMKFLYLPLLFNFTREAEQL